MTVDDTCIYAFVYAFVRVHVRVRVQARARVYVCTPLCTYICMYLDQTGQTFGSQEYAILLDMESYFFRYSYHQFKDNSLEFYSSISWHWKPVHLNVVNKCDVIEHMKACIFLFGAFT